MSAVIKQRVTLSKSSAQFIAQPRQLLIGGRWQAAASGKTFAVHDPSTGEVIAQAALGEAADIDKAVQAARRAFESGPWPSMSPSARGRLIHRIGDLILEHAD